MSAIPNVLTIAGSDSGGGAGIQADLKAMSARGVYGCSVITALTAQNTRGVADIHAVPPAFVRAQLDAVLGDIEIAAVKIGMLGAADVVVAVADGLAAHGVRRVVLDPVMVAKSGDRLLREDAVAALRDRLLPRAEIITPNLPEAADLLGRPEPRTREEMLDAARALAALGPAGVLLKGGHLPAADESPDLLVDGDDVTWLEGHRVATQRTHGTGCTLSSALAAELAWGAPALEAVRAAKAYLTRAIAHADALGVGRGHGPVHHFHALWPPRP
jgi:hydroxymethylpyrimidine/phosphomethylpyrimidine kinase